VPLTPAFLARSVRPAPLGLVTASLILGLACASGPPRPTSLDTLLGRDHGLTIHTRIAANLDDDPDIEELILAASRDHNRRELLVLDPRGTSRLALRKSFGPAGSSDGIHIISISPGHTAFGLTATLEQGTDIHRSEQYLFELIDGQAHLVLQTVDHAHTASPKALHAEVFTRLAHAPSEQAPRLTLTYVFTVAIHPDRAAAARLRQRELIHGRSTVSYAWDPDRRRYLPASHGYSTIISVPPGQVLGRFTRPMQAVLEALPSLEPQSFLHAFGAELATRPELRDTLQWLRTHAP
jgi:hypothetical protein